VIEEVEAKPFHCGILARTLRAEHRDILAKAGAPIHKQLREYFDFSILRRTWKMDGKVVAMAGVLGTLSSRETAWLALSDEITAHPVMIMRRAERYIEEVTKYADRISCDVLAGDKKAIDFARFLGFMTVQRREIMGVPIIHMSRIRLSQVA